MINTFWYVLVANCCNEWLDHPNKIEQWECNHRDDNDHQHYHHHDHHDHGHHDHEAYPKRAGVQHHHTYIPHLHPKLPLNLKQANQVCWQEEVTMLVSGCKQKRTVVFSHLNHQSSGIRTLMSQLLHLCHSRSLPYPGLCQMGNGRCSFLLLHKRGVVPPKGQKSPSKCIYIHMIHM